MPRATISVTVPSDVWIGDLSRRFPGVELRVRSARSADDVGVALAELRGPGVGEFVEAARDREPVADLAVFWRQEGAALVQIETATPLLLAPMEAAAVPIEGALTLRDGEVTVDLVTTRDRLSTLGDQLDAFGVDYDLRRVRPEEGGESLLTDEQSRVVEAALELGYYDSPRTCTLTELADHLGIAKSTCSETLHRAEERIVKQFGDASPGAVGDALGADGDPGGPEVGA